MKGNKPLDRIEGIPVSMVGAAGVHFVVLKLSLRGLIALPTIRNTLGVDMATGDIVLVYSKKAEQVGA